MKKILPFLFLILTLLACRSGASDAHTPGIATPIPPALNRSAAPTSTSQPGWLSHSYGNLAHLDYPAGWMVETINSDEGIEIVMFISADGSQHVRFRAAAMTPEEYRRLDPLNPLPNEGGYVVHWPQTFRAGDLDWNWHVWGQLLDGRLDGAPELIAQHYAPEENLYLWLSVDFPLTLEEQAKTNSLSDLVPTHFEIFNRMVASVHWRATGSISIFRGLLRQGADLGEAKSIARRVCTWWPRMNI